MPKIISEHLFYRDNTDFLPVAYIAGLQPGIPVTVPITVVAEDGVTSLTYYIQILREVGAGNGSGDASDVLSGLLGDSPASSPSGGLDSSTVFMSSNPQLATPPPPFFNEVQLQEGEHRWFRLLNNSLLQSLPIKVLALISF